MEWGILITAIILCVIGIVALFSATQETEYEEFTKQIIWFVVSLIAMVIVMFIDYNLLLKASPVLYGIFIVLLIGVLFTSPINGATSWFDIGAFSFHIFCILLVCTYNYIQNVRKNQGVLLNFFYRKARKYFIILFFFEGNCVGGDNRRRSGGNAAL